MRRLWAWIPLVLAPVACVTVSEWRDPSEYTGRELFQSFCASCHGENGTGHGPVAPLLNAPVADLTHIAARNGGQFPRDRVYRTIDGQAETPAHGSRHMPVWGYEFYGDSEDDRKAHRQAERTIDRLVKYVESLQKPEWVK